MDFESFNLTEDSDDCVIIPDTEEEPQASSSRCLPLSLIKIRNVEGMKRNKRTHDNPFAGKNIFYSILKSPVKENQEEIICVDESTEKMNEDNEDDCIIIPSTSYFDEPQPSTSKDPYIPPIKVRKVDLSEDIFHSTTKLDQPVDLSCEEKDKDIFSSIVNAPKIDEFSFVSSSYLIPNNPIIANFHLSTKNVPRFEPYVPIPLIKNLPPIDPIMPEKSNDANMPETEYISSASSIEHNDLQSMILSNDSTTQDDDASTNEDSTRSLTTLMAHRNRDKTPSFRQELLERYIEDQIREADDKALITRRNMTPLLHIIHDLLVNEDVVTRLLKTNILSKFIDSTRNGMNSLDMKRVIQALYDMLQLPENIFKLNEIFLRNAPYPYCSIQIKEDQTNLEVFAKQANNEQIAVIVINLLNNNREILESLKDSYLKVNYY